MPGGILLLRRSQNEKTKTVAPDYDDVGSDPATETMMEKSVRQETMPPNIIRRNMFCCVLMDSGWGMGWTGVMIALTPLLVFLGASNTTIGMVTGASLAAIPGQLITPFITRRFPYKKWYFLIINTPYLFPIAVVGVVVIFSGNLGTSNSSLLFLVASLMLFHWFFGGFLALPHMEFIVACIPPTHRGRFTGLINAVGSGFGLAATPLAGIVLATMAEPYSYGYVFLFGWVFMQGFYVAAIFAKETRTPVEKSPKPWSKAMIKAFWDDKNYVKYACLAILRTLFLGTNIWIFLNVYGFKEVGMPRETTSAIMVGIMLVVRIGFATPLGLFADKVGPKRLLPLWMLVAAVAPLPAVLLRSAIGVYSSIALAYFFKVGADTSSVILYYGLPKPENRAGHFTITMLFGEVMLGLGPILLGIMGDIFSLRTMFMVISIIAVMMFFLARYVVRNLPDSTKDLS